MVIGVGLGGYGGSTTANGLYYENYDASGGGYPVTFRGGSILKGRHYIVTVASPPDGNGDVKFPLNSIVISRANYPGQVDANWKIVQA